MREYNTMFVPVENIVDQVDLTPNDVLLPLMECIVNSLISLKQSDVPKYARNISVQIQRGGLPQAQTIDNQKTIAGFKVIDNGVGFTDKNFKSFKTPFSKRYQKLGCKGIGRFTVLAAYDDFIVKSAYVEDKSARFRHFTFSKAQEVEVIEFEKDSKKVDRLYTSVEVKSSNNPILREKSAISLEVIAESIMSHCLVFYLSGDFPKVVLSDSENNESIHIHKLFEKLSKEREKHFTLKGSDFRLFITKTPKEGNRKNNYLYYCANSRTVGTRRNLGTISSLFSYPQMIQGKEYLFDLYLVSEYLDTKAYKARNGFNIPKERENLLFGYSDLITFQDIEEKIIELISDEYQDHVIEAKKRSKKRIISYIRKAPRYRSFLGRPEILESIPPGLSDEKLEEYLHKISFKARQAVDSKIESFIEKKEINEESIKQIIDDIKEKTAFDVDSLADYMMRRKAVIELFDKFLDADKNGKYKLEEDVHNLIFPMGLTNDQLDYENHNLWLLDERFLTYQFIASDKPISSFSQVKNRKEPDLFLADIFDNPISFGDKSSGEVSSMVIFEFKRPGETAHQKNKTDYRWEFSELIDKYFEAFLYDDVKKNYKGNQVIVEETTPKFGFVILDDIPKKLAKYNQDSKGWKKTPFGTYYKMESGINLHIEVMTFRKLLEFSKARHNPFFDKLFS